MVLLALYSLVVPLCAPASCWYVFYSLACVLSKMIRNSNSVVVVIVRVHSLTAVVWVVVYKLVPLSSSLYG